MKEAKKKEPLCLNSAIRELSGIGPKKAENLKKLGIEKLSDVLDIYPRSYEDLRFAKNICDIQDDDKVMVRARVLLSRPGRGWGRKRTLSLLVEDSTGRMNVLFFMAGFMKFEIGAEYRFFGRCKSENGRITMFHPTYSIEDGEECGILPVYPLTKGITQKDMRKISRAALEFADQIPETLPEKVVSEANICSKSTAMSTVHYPENDENYRIARYRLVFEELFGLKTAMELSRNRGGNGRDGIPFTGDYAIEFAKSLLYKLTSAQERVLKEVLADMKRPVAMNRLVQGDVGSGKTVIAEAALVQAVKNGYQGAFMAPTEILANQHFRTLSDDLEPLGIKVGLLIGSMTAKERRETVEMLRSGEIQIAVGTHALISAGVGYKNLGLVITDEQHRFGVNQRQTLSSKGLNPDVLVMTATPIPRTLAVVLYADLDVSVIDELPPGRVPIITKKYDKTNRKEAYKLALEQLKEGRQLYIVAPFIEESETLDGYSAEDLYEDFSSRHKDISCALLHGQMKQSEKDEIMARFYDGSLQVLISTVVIEVGINVPNASVMLIENQERFGLAQLHQLRGRVGRGKYQSYCLLVSGDDSLISKQRAEIMCATNDGFVIAEKDLEMRGPGEFFGYRQHGLPQLRLADPIKHMKVAEAAGKLAKELVADDPQLAKEENLAFASYIQEKYMLSERITL